MAFQERLALWLKICLPFLFLVVLNAYPHNRAVESGLHRVRAAQRAGQHQAAALEMRAVYAREPWRTDLLEQVGREEYQAGQFKESAEAFESARAEGALSLEGAYLLGEVYYNQGEYALAQENWAALAGSPQAGLGLRSRAHDRLVQLHRQQGAFEAAIAALRAWHSLEPENARVAFLLGLHLSAFDPAQALPLLLEASHLDPVYTPLVQTLRRGINLANGAEDPAYGWLMVGRSLGSTGDWDLAEVAFEQAVSTAPAYAEAWAFLGEARYQLNGSGKTELDQAVALNPQSTVVRTLQALSWRRQGDLDQALALLQSVAKEEPQEPIWQVEIANIYVEKGDLAAAQDHFVKAVTLAPQVSRYWQHLARFSVQYDVDIPNLGLPAARQAVLLSPDDPAALDVLGWALISQSDFATAERILQHAVEKDAAYSPALLHLGQLYIQQQDFERAYVYLKRAKQYAGGDQVGFVANRLLARYFNESD